MSPWLFCSALRYSFKQCSFIKLIHFLYYWSINLSVCYNEGMPVDKYYKPAIELEVKQRKSTLFLFIFQLINNTYLSDKTSIFIFHSMRNVFIFIILGSRFLQRKPHRNNPLKQTSPNPSFGYREKIKRCEKNRSSGVTVSYLQEHYMIFL